MTDERERAADSVDKLIDLILSDLGAASLRALKLMAAPHWVPPDAVFLDLRDDVLAELPALIDAELVRVSASGSLYVTDSIRHRLRALATEEETALVSARMAAIFRGGSDVESGIETFFHELFVDPLAASRDMFRTALTWRAEPFFAYHLVQRLLAAWKEAHSLKPLPRKAHDYLRFVELTVRAGSPERELAALEELDASEDELFLGFVLLRKGHVLTLLNGLREAQACLAKAYVTFEKLEHAAGMSHAHRLLGRVAWKRDAYATATVLFQHALDKAEEAGRKHLAAVAQQGLADVASLTGDYDKAIARYEKAIAELMAIGGRSAEANARNNYSQVLTASGDLDSAREHARLAEAIFENLDQPLGRANALRATAQVDIEAGELDAAETHLQTARAIYEELRTATGIAYAVELLGQVRQIRGDLDGAEAHYQEAQGRFEEMEDSFGVARCLRDRGAVALERGHSDEAQEHLAASATRFQKIGARAESAAAALLLWLAGGREDPDAAARTLTEAGAAIPRVYRRVVEASAATATKPRAWGELAGLDVAG